MGGAASYDVNKRGSIGSDRESQNELAAPPFGLGPTMVWQTFALHRSRRCCQDDVVSRRQFEHAQDLAVLSMRHVISLLSRSTPVNCPSKHSLTALSKQLIIRKCRVLSIG